MLFSDSRSEPKKQIARKNPKNTQTLSKKTFSIRAAQSRGGTPRPAEGFGRDSRGHTIRRSGRLDGFRPPRRAGGHSERRRARLSHAGGGHERRRGDSFERRRRALFEPQVCGNDSQTTGKSCRDNGSLAG